MTQNNNSNAFNKINTISDEVEAQANQLNPQSPQRHASQSTSSAQHSSSNNNNNNRWSFKRKSSHKSRTTSLENENESITLQESERHAPLQLKASLLRRKIKEYEGNERR
ncbi:hypothetical protein PVAND_008806 [Polypedilum vanderplanki]|uniref:Uncharacterized protein n=1 Tax=Polypedilum vanderplanki TaxID=319348 RepID=A0A9J6CAR6_POLVA|nr:hypothetical protein PVAND_008806 [Polypedilum vanderplanki]